MGVRKATSIKQALQYVADHPEVNTDDIIGLPVHELVSRTLFEIANGGHPSKRGSLSRANMAREMIFMRLVGRRRTGTHPATREQSSITFHDLTGGKSNDG